MDVAYKILDETDNNDKEILSLAPQDSESSTRSDYSGMEKDKQDMAKKLSKTKKERN